MNKSELLALANKGKVEINGIPLEVIVRPSAVDGTDWIEINVEPFTPLHQPMNLGNKWVEYITDEECAELPGALEKYKKEAEEFFEKAKTVVKAKVNPDGSYSLVDVPDAVKEEFKDYPKILKSWMQEKKHIVFIGDDKEYWRAPGNFSLELTGVIYKPLWSYWMDCAYYEADEYIRRVAER